jgi:hypothetical protein
MKIKSKIQISKLKMTIQNSKIKMIVAQQKFLSEIFAEHPKFCILIFAFLIFIIRIIRKFGYIRIFRIITIICN